MLRAIAAAVLFAICAGACAHSRECPPPGWKPSDGPVCPCSYWRGPAFLPWPDGGPPDGSYGVNFAGIPTCESNWDVLYER
jgi:hypothetical protein